MSPHTKGKERTPATLKNISGKRNIGEGGGGRGGKWLKETSWHGQRSKKENLHATESSEDVANYWTCRTTADPWH